MGMSSYFEVVPDQLNDAIARDPKLACVIECLWGVGTGMFTWFQELPDSEVESISQGCSKIVSEDIARLRRLFAELPHVPNAYIEKTHDLHQAMLSSAFSRLGASTSDELADLAVFGNGNWPQAPAIAQVTHTQCKQLASLLARVDARSVVDAFDLNGRTPEDTWRADLTTELEAMIDCYIHAGDNGRYVITATTG